jgi:hypothetical protein
MLAVAAAVAATSFASGAYFPTSWGWAALTFAWVGVVTLLVRRVVSLSRLEWAMLTALLGLTGWIALSTAWSSDVTQTVREVERTIVYLTGLGALLIVARRRSAAQLLAGVFAGIALVSAYGLATRLFPDRLGSYDSLALNRLARPLGYWNAVGIFAAMGCVLAVVFAARARAVWARALAAAMVPILLPTLYFTFGRGSWIALGVGLFAALAIDARRLQLLSTLIILTPGPAIAVWLASGSSGLTTNAPPPALASSQGHRLALIILGLAAAEGLAVAGLAMVERRLPELPRARLAYGAAVFAIALAGLATLFSAYGGPPTLVRKAYHAFESTGTGSSGTGANLNNRLFSLAGNGRPDYWKAAWHDWRARPLLGSGAGTYEQYWLQHRSIQSKVRDAHSLYMETLAELGLPGLALLVMVLAAPLVAALHVRRSRFTAGAVGAYIAYVVHAAADWDWEMTAITLTALFCAAALLLSARDEGLAWPISVPFRAVVVALTVAVGGFALVGLVSNSALATGTRAARSEKWGKAESQARKVIRWTPWSSAGWQLLGVAQYHEGKLVEARASFRRAIGKDSRDWTLWFDLALASKGAARRGAATVALRLNPLSPEIADARTALGLGPG